MSEIGITLPNRNDIKLKIVYKDKQNELQHLGGGRRAAGDVVKPKG